MKSFNFAAAAMALLLAHAPSSAQMGEKELVPAPLGSRIPRWETPARAGDREAAGVLMDFASCTVKRDPGKSAAVLRTIPDSAEQQVAIRALLGNGKSACLQAGKMMLSEALFRGALAEALLKDSGRLAAPPPATVKADEFGTFAERLKAAHAGDFGEADQTLLVGRWLAHCLSREHPEAIRQILLSKRWSREEARALHTAGTTFPLCLLKGQVLKVDRLSLRALLAEAYFRTTLATSPGA